MASGNNAEYKKSWYLKNKERILAKKKAEYEADPEKFNKRVKAYRRTESGIEMRKGEQARYQSKPDVKAARASRQKARELSKRNSCLLPDDEWNSFVIEEMYSLSKQRELDTGIKWNVDHIIPINGKTVCGLHVWYNLRVITAHENCIKSNKLQEGL